MHRKRHNDQVSNSVGSDQGLNHGDVRSTLSLSSPLSRDWVAQEDTSTEIGDEPHADKDEGSLG